MTCHLFKHLENILEYDFPLLLGAGASASEGASVDQVAAVNAAKECLLAAIKADAKSGHIWANLANAFYMCGDHRSSSKCLEKVLMASFVAYLLRLFNGFLVFILAGKALISGLLYELLQILLYALIFIWLI